MGDHGLFAAYARHAISTGTGIILDADASEAVRRRGVSGRTGGVLKNTGGI